MLIDKHLLTLSLSPRKNFSLSSSTNFSILSSSSFFSCNPRLVTSIGQCTIFPLSSASFNTPFLMRSNVGKRSITAHLRSSSLSSWAHSLLMSNTFGGGAHTALKFIEGQLRWFLLRVAKSFFVDVDAIFQF